jgi:hypothetical protein
MVSFGKQSVIFRDSNLRLIDGNKDEVLLEQVYMSGPCLHPVVLPLLHPDIQQRRNMFVFLSRYIVLWTIIIIVEL